MIADITSRVQAHEDPGGRRPPQLQSAHPLPGSNKGGPTFTVILPPPPGVRPAQSHECERVAKRLRQLLIIGATTTDEDSSMEEEEQPAEGTRTL